MRCSRPLCLPQHMVPGGRWFGSYPAEGHAAPQTGADFDYSLVGCTVAPGFDVRTTLPCPSTT